MILMVALIILVYICIILLAELYSNRKQRKIDLETISVADVDTKTWWAKQRTKYNLGLIIAGFSAFTIYYVVGTELIAPHDSEFDITLFTIAFQAAGYLIMMLIANLFYNLGYYLDRRYNKQNSMLFRRRIFNLGFWFSVALPFSIPIILIVQYFIEFYKK